MKILEFLKGNWWTFIKYVVVGISGTIIDVAGFTGLVHYTNISRNGAATISFIAAVINNFTWNRLWTFKSRVKNIGKQFFEFLLVSIGGLVLNLLFLSLFSYLFVSSLELPDVESLPAWANASAKLGASGVVLIYNFLANRFITFSPGKEKAAADKEQL